MRWLKIPEFQKAYREARRAAFGQSIARLQQATSAAAATLMKIMVDPSAPGLLRERMRRHGLECDDAGNVPPQNHQHQTLREVLRARFTKCP
jgi:hypothetical protein